jgi:predicted small secreted protein
VVIRGAVTYPFYPLSDPWMHLKLGEHMKKSKHSTERSTGFFGGDVWEQAQYDVRKEGFEEEPLGYRIEEDEDDVVPVDERMKHKQGGSMRQLCLIILAGTFLVAASGCNTMHGAGQDVENTGKNIQETVEKND